MKVRGKLLSDYNLSSLIANFNKISNQFSLCPQSQGIWQAGIKESIDGEHNFIISLVSLMSVSDEFSRAWYGYEFDIDRIKAQVHTFAKQMHEIAQSKSLIVFLWTVDPSSRTAILSDMKKPYGKGYLVNYANNILTEELSSISSVILIDTISQVRLEYNDRSYFISKQPFSLSSIDKLSSLINDTLCRAQRPSKKVIILDLDNTLWGGIVGDDGWENLDIGGHSYSGEAYKAFQEELLALKRRGVLLTVVSKNTESIAIEAIESHPEMSIKMADIVGHRINWNDKAENILALSEELNLGLNSFVFIDDSPIERERVREALPDVFTPDLPNDPTKFRDFLRNLDCFDTSAVSDEDRARTESYKQNLLRNSSKSEALSIDDWISSLNLKITVYPLNHDLNRATQLLNKTNQMNLSTRRLSAAEFSTWAMSDLHHVRLIDVTDRFGKLGITGIVSIACSNTEARLIDFVLSCRAMGRLVENFMVALASQIAREMKCVRLVANFIPTEKNEPLRAFLQKSSCVETEPNIFVWEDLSHIAPPQHIEVTYV